MKGPTKLYFFDFDGTLFRSPEIPASYKGRDWWTDQRSLTRVVPDVPGNEWWNMPLVNIAKKAYSNQDIVSAMATGRLDDIFRWRIPELLQQQSIGFDYVKLRNRGSHSTFTFKRDLILAILNKYPSISEITVWEDRNKHIKMFADFLNKLNNIEFSINKVKLNPVRK